MSRNDISFLKKFITEDEINYISQRIQFKEIDYVKENLNGKLFLYGDYYEYLKSNKIGYSSNWYKIFNNFMIPVGPKVEKVNRNFDLYTFPHVEKDKWINGTFARLDMNSAEPYCLSLIVPSLSNFIENHYEKLMRIKKEKGPYSLEYNKQRLFMLSANGCMRHHNSQLYIDTCNKLYDFMVQLYRDNNNEECVPMAIRRDGMIFWLKNPNYQFKNVKIGNGLGQWKEDRGKGRMMFDSNKVTIYSDVLEIDSKNIPYTSNPNKIKSILSKIGKIKQ